MNRKTKKVFHNGARTQKVVWGSGVLLLFLFGLYGYFLSGTILNVVERKNIEDQHATLQAQISELEYRYIALNSRLDISYAKKLGFRKVESPRYTTRVEDRALTLLQ